MLRPNELFPCPAIPHNRYRSHSTSNLLASTLMSHSRSALSSSSSHFRAIMETALQDYQNRTKKDLAMHPISAQLEASDSPAAIFAVFRQQIPEVDRFRSPGDDRWTEWLGTIIDVLCALSASLGEGNSLVSLETWIGRDVLSHLCGRHSHMRFQYLPE